MYKKYVKRIIDFVLSLFSIIILFPVLLILAVLIRIKLGPPVIFIQKRPGKNEEIFKLFKFKTMTNECDDKGNLLPDDLRLNKFGRLLRSTSLDELPELFNILIGDMSIIGPRPLLVEYLPRYSDFQKRRHEVRPGLSGLAQINGRNALSWEQKFEYDIQYVDNVGFMNDMKIVAFTLIKVLRREGINSINSVTMEEFIGESKVKNKHML